MLIFGSAMDDVLGGTTDDDTIYGLGGQDVITGGPGADLADGGDGDDFLRGRQGADTLLGGAGDDLLNGGSGDDILDGGAGRDRVSFAISLGGDPLTSGVTVSLLLQGQAQDTGHGLDTLIGIEDLSGTSFGDRLTGDAGANWLLGNGGSDTLSGGGGDDLLEIDGGDSVLDGGAGVDTLSLYGNAMTPGGVRVSLDAQGVAQASGVGALVLTSIENLSGAPWEDLLIGDQRNNILAGHDGSDTLLGGKGDDTLYGDGAIQVAAVNSTAGPIVVVAELPGALGGADLLDGGKGKDALIGGAGADRLAGGESQDRFIYLDLSDSLPDARDLIVDLEPHDTIDLRAVDADAGAAGDQAFRLVLAFTGHAGEAVLSYERAFDVTHLMLDVTGDGAADMVIDLAGDQTKFDNLLF